MNQSIKVLFLYEEEIIETELSGHAFFTLLIVSVHAFL